MRVSLPTHHWVVTIAATLGLQLLAPFSAVAEESHPPKLISVERVSPPKKLYHWTSSGWLGEWATTAQKASKTKLPLMTDFSHKLSGSILKRSLRSDQKGAIFAWDHPVGGMAAWKRIYPEKNHPDEAAEAIYKLQGGSMADEKSFQKFKDQLKQLRFDISGLDSGVENRFMVDMDIDPNAVAIKIKIETYGDVWANDNYIRDVIPELAKGEAQLVYLEYGDNMREWIILDNKAVRRFNADPRYQIDILKPQLANLRTGQPLQADDLHVRGGFLSEEKGRKEATLVLSHLVDEAESSSTRIPAFFKNVPPTVNAVPPNGVPDKIANNLNKKKMADRVQELESEESAGAGRCPGGIRGMLQRIWKRR